MTEHTSPHADPPHDQPAPATTATHSQQARTAGEWAAHTLLWVLTSATALLVAGLAWAVTALGGGWYLLFAAICLCAPLPLWYLLTDRPHRKRPHPPATGLAKEPRPPQR